MEFNIPDMSCGGCANAITRALTDLDAAATLEADVAVKNRQGHVDAGARAAH